MLAKRKIEWLLFAAAFFAYGYFCQGGGWAQNARFAMVRAIVEENHYWIDNYLIYARTGTTDRDTTLVRVPIRDAALEVGASTYALAWADTSGRGKFINNVVDPSAKLVNIFMVSATGDLSYVDGHFHPNKAPGTSLLAALPYFVIYRVERLVGANPDDWWTLTLNAWLATVFSSGLISAFGCVLVFQLALALSGGNCLPSLLAAIAFALGTMFFPLATLLQDQNIAAVLLLASSYLLYGVKEALRATAGAVDQITATRLGRRIALSGLCAGYAAITNFVAVAAVVGLGVYLFRVVRGRNTWKWFALGVAGPLFLICLYNLVCFGTVFTTNYRYESPWFESSNGVMRGFLAIPHWDVLLTVLFSPFRGLFFSAPILLMGAYGLFCLFRTAQWRAEACLFVYLVGLYVCFNASFRGWHGGWIAVPRYLGPAVPFLAVPMVFGFIRFPRMTSAVAIVSVTINLLFTAVDPQVPTEFDAAVNAPTWPQWRHAPLLDYALPMFLTGRAGPFLERQLEEATRDYAKKLDADGVAPQEKNHLLAARREEWEGEILDREMPSSNGPVSGNPMGVYEGGFHRLFPAASRQTEWNSFNLGEFVFPQSRLSLLPLAVVCGGLFGWALTVARRAGEARISPG